MPTTYPFSDLRYLPAKLVTNKNDAEGIKKYEAMSPEDKKKFGGLWWSLHDIIDTFGSGIFKEENDANYFSYVIDLDADHFKELRLVDANLAMSIDRDMTTNLTGVSTKITNYINEQKMASSAAMNAAVVGVAAANKPFMMGGPPADPNAAPNANGMPNAAPDANEPAWSPKNLEAECFKDIVNIQLTSKSRIFVIRTTMTPITEEQKKRIESEGDEEILVKQALSAPAALPGQPAAPGAVPAAPISGGLTKTRKGRKGKKKRKTRRHARKLPFKKR
jgi:hypothetical protein